MKKSGISELSLPSRCDRRSAIFATARSFVIVLAMALAIVSTKPESHFSRSAGGYFAGMVRKAERGELRLERSLWALREARYGKPNQRRAN